MNINKCTHAVSKEKCPLTLGSMNSTVKIKDGFLSIQTCNRETKIKACIIEIKVPMFSIV